MKDFLNKIVSLILDPNSKFQIEEKEEGDLTTYNILVPEEEFGKMIGKGGKVINAVRVICRLKAIQNQKKILVKVDKLAS